MKYLLPDTDTLDVWERIKAENKPIVIYGMGNGADKLISKLYEYNLKVSSVFASDEFVRGQVFHGFTVEKFDDVKNKYADFIIVVAFASRLDSVIERLFYLSDKYKVYIPDMPVIGDIYFTGEFYRTNYERLRLVYLSLNDELSREVFASIITFRLSGDINDLLAFTSTKNDIYALINAKSIKYYLDGGAYNGDTVKSLLDFGATPETVIAIEPDEKTYKRLTKYVIEENRTKIISVNCALWEKDEKLLFSSSSNKNSSLENTSFEHKNKEIEAKTVDSIVGNTKVDFIKFDLEGAELCALTGSVITIRNNRPVLDISAYHKSEDFFTLPEFIIEKFNDYFLYFRRTKCFPAWETELLAIPKEYEHGK